MKRPLLSRLLPSRFKQPLYYRYYHTRHADWPGLFEVAPLTLAPSIAMHAFLAKVTTEELLADLTGREAFGRAAEPWEIANVITFLASDLATYMTGEVVSVSSQHA